MNIDNLSLKPNSYDIEKMKNGFQEFQNLLANE